MGLKNAYRTFAGFLTAITIAGSPGCAVEPTKETPTPSTTIEQTLEPTIKPTLTPIVTPSPTPELMFKTVEDIDNQMILQNQAQLFINKVNNSNVPYSDYFKKMDEATFINYLKWCNARISNEEISLEAAQLILDNFINAMVNEEVVIIWDILEGKRPPIQNANFVGYAPIMPTTSKTYELSTRINEIKNELVSLPSKERQIELAQESLNMSLDFMLSNDAPYGEENVRNHFMIEDDGKNIENSNIETFAFKICIWFDMRILVNMAYIIDPSLKAQYPSWHPQYPNYMEISDYDKKYADTFDYIYYQTTQKMVDECIAYSNIATPMLSPKN